MIDINKSRNNFQKFPSLKQKCEPLVKVKSNVSAKPVAVTTNTVTAAVEQQQAATVKATTTTTTTTNLKHNNQSEEKSNAVRAANQQFFLVSAYKDQNFLKEECELAHAQVAPPPTTNNATVVASRRGGEDNRNNNQSNPSQIPRTTAVTNGMRRSGNNGTTAAATTVHKVDIAFNHYKAPPKNTKQQSAAFAPAFASNSKLSGSSRQVKPLVHRTIPSTAVAAAYATSANNRADISYSNKVNNNTSDSRANNSNNNMQQPSNSIEHDDIKYIDDTSAATLVERKAAQCEQRCCMPHHASAVASVKTRVRPKSTIICSATNQLFEKVNNYKYANGDIAAAARRHELRHSGIDSGSLKASIEKFNNFSEQKRMPLHAVTLRSHSGSGSVNNLPHHRHSSDFDNCNLRLPNSSGGSLTRTPYRSGATGNTTTTVAPTTSSSTGGSKVITSLQAANASAAINATRTAFTGNNSSSLPTKSKNQHELILSRTAERASTSSLAAKDVAAASAAAVSSTSNNKSPSLSSKQHDSVADTKKTAVAIAGGEAIVDVSVRSSATIRSVLPPPSPTASRIRDRDLSSRTATSSSHYSSDDLNSSSKSSASDEKSEGLCGLRNIGNTCFMNSVIQCLSHTTELTKFLRTHNGSRSSSTKDQLILYEFAKLIREMWTSNVHSVTPMELKRAFSTKHRMYSDYNQQDAQEFLRFFLDSLHSALNSGVKGEHLKIDDNLSDNKKADLTWEWYSRHENSLIRDLFVGQLKSTLKCTTCGNTSVTFDPFWDLSVSLPSSSRCKLDACLDMFIREEILDGDEMPTCSKCHTRRKCTKSFCIQRFPKYLVIHLKRFSETRWSKLSNIVEFPTGDRELNMGSYGSNSNSSAHYSLYAISNHMGSTAGGHYVALCKHPVSKKWHEFNDNIVSDALSENHLVSSSAYILFYERS